MTLGAARSPLSHCSWDALAEIGEKDEAGNVIIGEVRVKDFVS